MTYKISVLIYCLFVLLCTSCESASASFGNYLQKAVKIELIAFSGLADNSLFKGSIDAEGKLEIDTPYRGLSLLSFEEGQQYPLIIGDEPFTLKVTDPRDPPSFEGYGENEFFCRMLSGGDTVSGHYLFALLMIQAKHLLKSSHSIHT